MPNKPLTLRQRADFAKHQVPLINSATLQYDATNLYHLIREQIQEDSALLFELERSYQLTLYLIDIAPQYDYSPNIRANGFWAFAQIIIKFYRLTLHSIKKDSFNPDGTRKALQVLNISLKCCEEIANTNQNIMNNNPNNSDEDDDSSSENSENLSENQQYSLFISSPDHHSVEIDYLTKKASQAQEEFVEFYEHFNGFWLNSCTMQIISQISDFMGIVYKQSKDFRINRNIFSRKRKAEMFQEMTLNVSIEELKRNWNLGENPLIGKWFNKFPRDLKNVSVRDIAVPPQKRWKIATDEFSTVYDTNAIKPEVLQSKSYASSAQNGIPCLILQSKEKTNKHTGTVLLHVHGGGFISQSPKSHKIYLQEWSDKYRDMTIVSVDYRLAPEHPFPAALQDILDVYLWLLRRDSWHFLGFEPTRIAFAGDSAGGNLVVASALVLNALQNIIPTDDPFLNEFCFPKAIFSFYGLYMIAPHYSPSRIIALNDGLLNLGPLQACLQAYLPIELDDRRAVKEFTRNPFLSPLLAKDFEFTKDISLYLFETTFDPFLDDNVELSKKWKGNVYFEVFPDLPHGFLNFIKISPKSLRANELCLEHFAQFCNGDIKSEKISYGENKLA